MPDLQTISPSKQLASTVPCALRQYVPTGLRNGIGALAAQHLDQDGGPSIFPSTCMKDSDVLSYPWCLRMVSLIS